MDIERTSDTGNGYNVGWMTGGEWLNYTISVPQSGTYTMTARVAANGAGGIFHVEFGGVNKTGPMTIPDTGGWQSWVDLTATVNLTGGVQSMRFVADQNGANGIFGNLNYIKLSAAGAAPSDVVMYSTDVTLPGAWFLAADASAASGKKVLTPDFAGPTVPAPLANPPTTSSNVRRAASTPYRIWLRLRVGDTKFSSRSGCSSPTHGQEAPSDRVDVGAAQNLENCFSCGVSGCAGRTAPTGSSSRPR